MSLQQPLPGLALTIAPSQAAHTAPTLILAVGNPSRGDDAVGPLLAERLQAWLALQPAQVQDNIELITDQQLVVEHVLDMQGRDRMLFIDAAAKGEQDVALLALATLPAPAKADEADASPASQAQPTSSQPISSHQCTPRQLLALYRDLLKAEPPGAALLTVTGHGFELGAGLSPQAQVGMATAWRHLLAWIGAPSGLSAPTAPPESSAP